MIRTGSLTILLVASFVAIAGCGSVSGPAGPGQSGGSGAGAGGSAGTAGASGGAGRGGSSAGGRGGNSGVAGDTMGIAGTTALGGGGVSGNQGSGGVAGTGASGAGGTAGAMGRGGNGSGGSAKGGNGNGTGNGGNGNGRGGNGNGGTGGAAGSAGTAGTTATGGRGGATGAGGSGGAIVRSCAPTCDRCLGVCCGAGCCAPGEWCDTSGATEVCRCNNGDACTNGQTCSASLGGPGICGTICCGGGGNPCPVSRRIFKRDITPVDDPALQQLYAELRRIQLTTYQYKQDPPSAPRRLGFIIDDTKTPYPINPDGNTVDLYGYMSMAVAAIQVQSREIEALRHEVARLKSRERRR